MFCTTRQLLLLSCLALPVSLTLSYSASIASKPQEVIAQKPRIDCSKANTTPELKYCSQLSYAAADKKLNQVYQKVLSSMKGEQRKLLITAEQTWVQFRDRNCNFEVYASRGGTGYEVFRNGCLERLTKQRTKDLEAYMSNRAQ